MSDESKLPTSDEGMDPKQLAELKRKRTELGRRRRILRGARDYHGDQAGQKLLKELEEVEQQYRQLDQLIKANERMVAVAYREIPGVNILFSNDGYKVELPDSVNRVEFDYIPLEEAGNLTINYDGTTPSLYDFSVFNIELARLINDAALALLKEHLPEQLEELNYAFGDALHSRRQTTPIVDARIESIGIGSFEEVISVTVISFLAHQDVRAILTNLVSNVIWGLGAKLGPVIRGTLPKPAVPTPDLEIGDNLRDVLIKYVPQGHQSVKVEFVEELPNKERRYLAIQVNSPVPALTVTTPTTPPQLPPGDGD